VGQVPASRTVVSPRLVRGVALAVGALASVGLTQFLVADPARVDQLTLRNPSEYPMFVTMSSGDGSGRFPLAVVGAGESVVITEVLDPGANWRLSMTAQGRDAGSIQLDRGQVEVAGGVIVIPDTVPQRLRDAGVAPPPRRG
jgi:hypothetical protein